MRDLFAGDAQRFERFSLSAATLTLDYSRNRVDATTMALLFALARERGVEAERDAMLTGEPVNVTERRAALHTALRVPEGTPVYHEGRDVMPEVHAVRSRMLEFAERVRSGRWRGYRGAQITDVVNIGIGGSDLGPRMACAALGAHAHPAVRMHFVSNIDGAPLSAMLATLQPDRTLFVIASKSFTTQETMTNAATARRWFLESGAGEADIARHFVAVSINTRGVTEFGIDAENMFGFWDWVGGRYSMWSAVGLPIAISIGADGFRALLAGAHAMDRHFAQAPLESNMPVVLALLGIWYRNFFDAGTVAVAPYAQSLADLPAYLQQLEMESNGKSTTRDGAPVSTRTGSVIWGAPGTNGQHAYFQLIHQGTDLIPVDFILPLRASHALPEHHRLLVANCIAQGRALMIGRDEREVRRELEAAGLRGELLERQVPHRVLPGNRPSNTLLMDTLTPESLGALIALYEHKVFVQSVIWNINPFDQWGVELGKCIAGRVLMELESNLMPGENFDASTRALVARARVAGV